MKKGLIEGWIAIYQYDDEIRIQPTLYKTKEEALVGLQGTLGKYFSNHLKFICEPIYVQLPTASCE